MGGDITRRRVGMLALAALPAPAWAAGPPVSILTVSGQITVQGGNARFDRDMLESLGTEGFQTQTPWYDKPVRFDGVRMSRLMQAVGATGSTVTAIALNDYSTDIPIADFERFGVILALKRDGAYMPVRDKGPLFIVYPYDRSPELNSQLYYSRSAWQVAKLIVG